MRKIERTSDGYYHLALTNRELGALIQQIDIEPEEPTSAMYSNAIIAAEIIDAIAEAYKPNEEAVDDDDQPA